MNRMAGSTQVFGTGRQLHVIDVENLLGSGLICVDDVVTLAQQYVDAIAPSVNAHFVVAASSQLGAVAAGLGWHGSRLCWRPGPDGADLALIDVLQHESVASRFSDIYIASGDHAFTDAAASLGSAGCRVTVVGREGHISARLRVAAHTVRYLDQDIRREPAAAA